MSRKTQYSLAVLTVLVAVAAVLAVRGATSSPKAEAGQMPPVAQVAHRVELVRHLRFRHVPKVQMISERNLAGKLREEDGALKGAARERAESEALAAQGIAALAGILRQSDVEAQ